MARFQRHTVPLCRHSSGSAGTPPERTEADEILGAPERLLVDPEALDPYQVVVVGREAETFLGRKAIDTFKNEMNRISDNVSESVDRDKKNLKKKNRYNLQKNKSKNLWKEK